MNVRKAQVALEYLFLIAIGSGLLLSLLSTLSDVRDAIQLNLTINETIETFEERIHTCDTANVTARFAISEPYYVGIPSLAEIFLLNNNDCLFNGTIVIDSNVPSFIPKTETVSFRFMESIPVEIKPEEPGEFLFSCFLLEGGRKVKIAEREIVVLPPPFQTFGDYNIDVSRDEECIYFMKKEPIFNASISPYAPHKKRCGPYIVDSCVIYDNSASLIGWYKSQHRDSQGYIHYSCGAVRFQEMAYAWIPSFDHANYSLQIGLTNGKGSRVSGTLTYPGKKTNIGDGEAVMEGEVIDTCGTLNHVFITYEGKTFWVPLSAYQQYLSSKITFESQVRALIPPYHKCGYTGIEETMCDGSCRMKLNSYLKSFHKELEKFLSSESSPRNCNVSYGKAICDSTSFSYPLIKINVSKNFIGRNVSSERTMVAGITFEVNTYE